ncbi:MAG: PAS domain S-box protein, partial [Nannocystaceae bacterium]
TAFDLQLELVTAKGRIIQCRAKGQAVIEGGRPVRVHGVFQDISEEFKVEQALRDSEELRLSILQDMRAGLVAQRADGTIFMSNPAALEILGLSEDEITGRTSVDERWYAIREDGSPFPGQDHPAMVSLRTGESVTGVIMGVFRPRTQDRAWILIDSVVQRNARGEIARVLSSFIDVTERKRAEDAARKSDAMFRAVFDNAGLGILIRDTGTSQLRANPTFLRMVGRTQQQLRSLSVADLVHPEDSGAADQAHAELLDGRVDSYELERRFCTGDGEQRWGHETVSLVRDDDGTPRYVVEMIVDVTDRKRMETQLMLADRMASLGTMAAGVGHELNNPLTWITGNISLALESLREHPNPTAESRQEILRSLEEAAVGASRVSAIVRDLQIFSRVDDDPEATTEPNLVVESTTRMLRNELKYRATLELDLAPVPEVLGDSARISQILTNLLVNALHALPDRPINDNHIRVRTRTDGDHVVLSVQDNGTGIPDGVRSRIFDPFFTTKAVGTGTGLGLSICHSLVARLGGRIELDTELGQGSVFRVLLVPAASRRTSKLADHAATAARARKRILCIDDEPIVGRLISRVLSNSHDVVVETSAEDALRRLSRGENYDAIICDLMMPNASGIDFFEKLQIVAPALSESCGFITGGAFTPRARSFTETLPPARLLHKPFRPQAVVEFVDELLGRTSPR